MALEDKEDDDNSPPPSLIYIRAIQNRFKCRYDKRKHKTTKRRKYKKFDVGYLSRLAEIAFLVQSAFIIAQGKETSSKVLIRNLEDIIMY